MAEDQMSRSLRRPCKRVGSLSKKLNDFYFSLGSSIPPPIWSTLCTESIPSISITQKLLVLKCSVRVTPKNQNSPPGSPNQRTEMAEGGG
jgi:hypothetical protein